jgi:hypothetical protein
VGVHHGRHRLVGSGRHRPEEEPVDLEAIGAAVHDLLGCDVGRGGDGRWSRVEHHRPLRSPDPLDPGGGGVVLEYGQDRSVRQPARVLPLASGGMDGHVAGLGGDGDHVGSPASGTGGEDPGSVRRESG